jgi:hypothetical protein
MDDKTTGVGNERGIGVERTSGRGDDAVTGRASDSRPAAPTRVEDRMTGGSTATRTSSTTRTREREPDQRTEEIRAEIEQTRGEMSETVNAIQERLRPRNIASNAAESVRNAASEKARDIADSEMVQSVRENPIPMAMIGIGIAGAAWMAFSRGESRRPYRRDYMRARSDWRTPGYREEDNYYRGFSGRSAYDTASTATPGLAYEADRGDYESGYDTSAGYANRSYEAGEMTENVRRRARRTASRAQNQMQRTWNDNPLLIGVASAVVGALVGLLVPETERENRLMGEARDNMLEGAQQMAKDTAKKVQDAAASAATSAVGLASSETPGEQKPESKGTGRNQTGKNQ